MRRRSLVTGPGLAEDADCIWSSSRGTRVVYTTSRSTSPCTPWLNFTCPLVDAGAEELLLELLLPPVDPLVLLELELPEPLVLLDPEALPEEPLPEEPELRPEEDAARMGRLETTSLLMRVRRARTSSVSSTFSRLTWTWRRCTLRAT